MRADGKLRLAFARSASITTIYGGGPGDPGGVTCPVCGRQGLLVERGDTCEPPPKVLHSETVRTVATRRGWDCYVLKSDHCDLTDEQVAEIEGRDSQ